ncbi:MAG: hypothetical protein IKS20_08310 [Victivallales bacterium]|nr:hypothetical protein [Victivallales bacterium]
MKCRLCLGLLLAICSILAAQDFKWIKTLEIEGNGIMQGPPMDLKGSKWRVRYSSQDNSPILVELYNANGTSKKEIIRSNNKQTTSGTRIVDYRGGFDKGFLRIRGSYSGWKVSFEQFVDDIRGWELTKLGKIQKTFDKLGIWGGDGGESMEIPLNVKDNPLRMLITNKSSERLKVEVVDEGNNPVAIAYMFSQGTRETWFYATGEYKLRINSSNTPWVVEVNELK